MRKISLIGNNEITLNNKSDCDRVVEDTIADLKELIAELTEPPEFASDNSSDYDNVSEVLLKSSKPSDGDDTIMSEIRGFAGGSLSPYTHPLGMRNDFDEGLKRYIHNSNSQRWIDENLFSPITALRLSKGTESEKDKYIDSRGSESVSIKDYVEKQGGMIKWSTKDKTSITITTKDGKKTTIAITESGQSKPLSQLKAKPTTIDGKMKSATAPVKKSNSTNVPTGASESSSSKISATKSNTASKYINLSDEKLKTMSKFINKEGKFGDQCVIYAGMTFFGKRFGIIPAKDAWTASTVKRIDEPVDGCVAVWSGGSDGHVGVVEYYEKETGRILFSDSNRRNDENIRIDVIERGELESSGFIGKNYKFLGYVIFL